MDNNYKNGGIGFIGLLTTVFIALKLCGVISWSWVWVLFPMWLVLAIAILLFLICLVGTIISGLMNKAFKFQNKEK